MFEVDSISRSRARETHEPQAAERANSGSAAESGKQRFPQSAMASQLAITDDLVRRALKSGVRKDLQAAAKACSIKANGTNVAMTTALKEYMQARADAAPVLEEPVDDAYDVTAAVVAAQAAATPSDNKPRTPAEFPSATPEADTPASYLSLGISGLKDPKTESPAVGNLAAYLDDLNVEASPRPLGDSNAEAAPAPEVVKPAIVATGPASEWRGTHVRF